MTEREDDLRRRKDLVEIDDLPWEQGKRVTQSTKCKISEDVLDINIFISNNNEKLRDAYAKKFPGDILEALHTELLTTHEYYKKKREQHQKHKVELIDRIREYAELIEDNAEQS